MTSTRHGVAERVQERRLRAAAATSRRSERGDAEHHRNEHRGHPIGQSLDRRPRALRLLDEPHDPGQRRLAPRGVARKTKLPVRLTVPPNTG